MENALDRKMRLDELSFSLLGVWERHLSTVGDYLYWKLVSISSKRSILCNSKNGLIAKVICHNIFCDDPDLSIKSVGIDLTLRRRFLHDTCHILYIYYFVYIVL